MLDLAKARLDAQRALKDPNALVVGKNVQFHVAKQGGDYVVTEVR